jgi:hypothetical protein
VIVLDQIDTGKLDLDTFELGRITVGNLDISPPPGLKEYATDVDLRPALNLVLRINAGAEAGGRVTWRFLSLDPATGLPTDNPLAGFLPPNKNPPEGQGRVLFTVAPKPGLATGAEIRNKATIFFDANAPIDTLEWLNTIDNARPTSRVEAVGPSGPDGVLVRWSGSDVGGGIQGYTIFVSENGRPFTPWLSNTTATSGKFVGTCGKSYTFYSTARDAAGNVEDAPATPDAAIAVGACDLAITDIDAPPKLPLGKKPVTRRVSVHVQNRGAHPVVIPDAAHLGALVTLTVESLGTCPTPLSVIRPQFRFPVTIKTKQKLIVPYDVTINCANDPVDSTAKNPGHEDYRVKARVDHAALGATDAHPEDDECPRSVTPPGAMDPYPDGRIVDKGCGRRKPDGTFGAAILIDVGKQ